MGVHRVVPDLSSQSLDRAKVFYGEVLGLQPLMDHGWILTLADPERPGAQLSLMTHDETAPVIPAASIQVDDVDACHAAAVRAGAEIVHPLTDEPWGVRRYLSSRPGRTRDQCLEPWVAAARSIRPSWPPVNDDRSRIVLRDGFDDCEQPLGR